MAIVVSPLYTTYTYPVRDGLEVYCPVATWDGPSPFLGAIKAGTIFGPDPLLYKDYAGEGGGTFALPIGG